MATWLDSKFLVVMKDQIIFFNIDPKAGNITEYGWFKYPSSNLVRHLNFSVWLIMFMTTIKLSLETLLDELLLSNSGSRTKRSRVLSWSMNSKDLSPVSNRYQSHLTINSYQPSKREANAARSSTSKQALSSENSHSAKHAEEKT